MAAAASSLHSQSQGLLRSASAFQTDAGTPRLAVPALQA
jgi:methyl-accepting chemotaxis protein-1 (serine sensor receptor)